MLDEDVSNETFNVLHYFGDEVHEKYKWRSPEAISEFKTIYKSSIPKLKEKYPKMVEFENKYPKLFWSYFTEYYMNF